MDLMCISVIARYNAEASAELVVVKREHYLISRSLALLLQQRTLSNRGTRCGSILPIRSITSNSSGPKSYPLGTTPHLEAFKIWLIAASWPQPRRALNKVAGGSSSLDS